MDREKFAPFHVNGLGIDAPPPTTFYIFPTTPLLLQERSGRGQIMKGGNLAFPGRVDQIRWKKGEGRRGGDFRNFYTANGRGRDETNMGK